MPWLFVIFILLPAVELALLVAIGRHVGFWPTIGLIVVTGVAGASLARRQGLGVLRKVQEELNEGKLPRSSIVDGVIILVAAALLVTPGVLTDFLGFLCLIPGARTLIKKYFVWLFRRALRQGRVRMTMWFDASPGGPFDEGSPPRGQGPPPGAEGEGEGDAGPGFGRIIDVKPHDRDKEDGSQER